MAETREKNNKRVEDLKKALESGGRVLPNNFEAEQAVLGCALIDPEICLTIIGRLEEIDFYNETHKNIFKAIRDLQKDSIAVDFVSVSDYLEKIGLINSVYEQSVYLHLQTVSKVLPAVNTDWTGAHAVLRVIG